MGADSSSSSGGKIRSNNTNMLLPPVAAMYLGMSEYGCRPSCRISTTTMAKLHTSEAVLNLAAARPGW